MMISKSGISKLPGADFQVKHVKLQGCIPKFSYKVLNVGRRRWTLTLPPGEVVVLPASHGVLSTDPEGLRGHPVGFVGIDG